MAYKQEQVKPYNEADPKSKQVEAMFDNIAPTYDANNRIMSLGIDRRWRNKGIALLAHQHPQTLLDVATGTGDFAILAAGRTGAKHIVGADISEGMMQIGRQKVEKLGLQHIISFQKEDCTQLSFPDESFDAVTATFGIRNFQDLDRGLCEMCRVLKPGGHLLILELSQPQHFPMKQLFHIYSHVMMPAAGCLIARDTKAYTYLSKSIEAFPQGEQMQQILQKAGFARVFWQRMTLGVCTLYLATK
ncbi:MAG: bifunctional demethylmenaquinone methyltransferase/2-methoxy-6-polyprenyl-1,4-benzoquinol methylase UbiE [Bacteroidaceae bacterium]|nr:bifunctional demethylmenaquinone methyltransferase/2-methoxy-6-polyprenyl-1,4-benzoquinol methylase UbiE [Bacteroidaceae bacterium]